MNTQVVRPPSPPSPKRTTTDALRPVLMAGALLGVLVLAALLAAWLTSPSTPDTDTLTFTVQQPTGGTLTGSGITCGTGGTSCSISAKDGQEIELRAEADEGYTFAGYTLDCAPSGRLEMKAGRKCGARFEPTGRGDPSPERLWTLTLTPPENGTIFTVKHECGPTKKLCSAEIPEGTIVSLEVLPDKGYRVQSYTGDCVDGTANMTKARSCGVVLVKGDGPSLPPAKLPQTSRPPGQVTENRPPPGGDGSPRPAGTTAGPSTPPVNPAPPTAAGPSAGQTAPASTAGGQGPPPGVPATPARPGAAQGPATNEPPAPARPEGPAGGREGDIAAAQKEASADIQRVLKAYRAAYERMDIPAMTRIQPGLNVAAHEARFGGAKSVKYTFGGDPEIEDLDVERGTARALVALKTEYEDKADKKQKPLEGKATYLLKRIDESKDWHIVKIDYAMSMK